MHEWLTFDAARARRVIVEFIRGYVDRSPCDGVVLGISGGLDSAVVAALCAEALGPERVHGLMMPGASSSPEDEELGAAVGDAFGLSMETVPIGNAVDAVASALGGLPEDLLMNVQPRVRMTCLYGRAQSRGALVVGTGNKSELLVGYFTKHGDGGADLLPIGDLYKTQVRALAPSLGVPASIIDRPPTAGLREGQTDEAELGMPYGTLDVTLAGLERDLPDEVVSREAPMAQVDLRRVQQMVHGSWHKRALPPIPKLGIRTPGLDWRQPLTSADGS